MKLAIVSSVGGHLSEMLQLRKIYEPYEHFYILNDAKKLPDFMEGRTYFIKHSERDLWTLYNIWECWRILAKERPGPEGVRRLPVVDRVRSRYMLFYAY